MVNHLTLAEVLTELIKEKGIYQADIARCLGLNSSAVSKWINDSVTPVRENLVNLRNCGFTTAEVNRLLAAAGYSALSPQEIAPLPPPGDLERYLRHVRDRQAILDFSIFQEGSEQDFASVPLDTFYIPLRLAARRKRKAQAKPQVYRP
jgi:transcriptional regulator with XRE-family HTH domain